MEPQENDKSVVVHKLREWDAQAVAEVIEFGGETTVVVHRKHLLRTAEFLASEPSLRFSFLSDITAVDRFPLEPRHALGVTRESIGQNLQRHVAPKLRIPCAIHLSHSSSANRASDFVGPEFGADGQRHLGLDYIPSEH